MKALYLLGASKTTTNSLGDNLPQSMVPIMNRPLLERSMANLRRWGVDEILINITPKSKAIREYFGDGSGFGIKINYISEEPTIGAVGILKKAGRLFQEPFFVFGDDILCSMDIRPIMQTHQSKSAGLTVAVIQAESFQAADNIDTDKDGYVLLPSRNKSVDTRKSGMISMEVYVVEPSSLNQLPEGMRFSRIREIFPALIKNNVKIAVCQGRSYCMDISTPEAYLQVHEDIFAGDFQISGVHFHEQSVFKDGKSIIDSTAVITGPVYIGDNVKIGAYAIIGPNAVIGDDVCVHMGGKVVDSVLWNNVDIGMCAKLKGTIAASDCKIKRKTIHVDAALTKSGIDKWKKTRVLPDARLGA